mmetsp:Transcript_13579/g.13159  ORF Transcript_13579/g.13159 Transcript_13579/m.13159 type:complete len:364 (-) Transcript_13579:59-1150(-)
MISSLSMVSAFAVFFLSCSSNVQAFGPVMRPAAIGGTRYVNNDARPMSSSVLLRMAEGGPPQYERRAASAISNEEVGQGTYLIRVAADDEKPVEYEPGHVLALEILNPEKGEDDEEEWLRGPYTVTRSDDSSFDVMYRVVGKKSQTFSAAVVKSTDSINNNARFQFGGKFKVPILEGIHHPEQLERIVLISTGVGVGPQMGFIEQALCDDAFAHIQIDLYAGFRNAKDVCCSDTLNDLATAHPDRFSWEAIVSDDVGRTSDPYALSKIANHAKKDSDSVNDKTATATHYHLIGNGSMVNEFKAGLKEAKIPDDRVTIEMYFNHKEIPRPDTVKSITDAVLKGRNSDHTSSDTKTEKKTTSPAV